MMPYALNVRKGTTITNDDLGVLEGGIATPITDRQVNIAKHIVGVVVFDRIAGFGEKKAVKRLYGVDMDDLKKSDEEAKTYKDFVKKHKDLKVASQEWRAYKAEKGI